ncbi:hypothetical protein F5Y16DRAFT_398173 [Xylariaceae sp. FL0255]|nr:hypothetical protein F5Y16DRAFT_398173 [Xylariaceae sp. FL0255]
MRCGTVLTGRTYPRQHRLRTLDRVSVLEPTIAISTLNFHYPYLPIFFEISAKHSRSGARISSPQVCDKADIVDPGVSQVKNKFMIRAFSLATKDYLSRTLTEPEANAFQDGDTPLTIKGTPDVLINKYLCFVNNAGDVRPLSLDVKATFEGIKKLYRSQGKGCILLARKVVHEAKPPATSNATQFEDDILEHSKTGLTLMGFIAIVGPLRPKIRVVVTALCEAGIRIFRVTSDYALTHTEARKRQRGERSHTLFPFKLRIAKEFQKDGAVGMTGDNVSDAPSLKAADAGIAFGSSSDIVIEAAEMAFLESFFSVAEAV